MKFSGSSRRSSPVNYMYPNPLRCTVHIVHVSGANLSLVKRRRNRGEEKRVHSMFTTLTKFIPPAW